MRQTIRTDKAPRPAASYEQGVRAGDLVFVSGQVANDLTGKIIDGSIEEQVTLALTNIENIVKAAGGDRNDIVRCGVYLSDLADFAAMNKAYTEFFGEAVPARTTVQAGLGELRVEIDAFAHVPAETQKERRRK
ncbi:MAG TPA: RidA family protein [Terriglobales bacterium]|nr:RidA family protein [Terriglobales bacterium]